MCIRDNPKLDSLSQKDRSNLENISANNYRAWICMLTEAVLTIERINRFAATCYKFSVILNNIASIVIDTIENKSNLNNKKSRTSE